MPRELPNYKTTFRAPSSQQENSFQKPWKNNYTSSGGWWKAWYPRPKDLPVKNKQKKKGSSFFQSLSSASMKVRRAQAILQTPLADRIVCSLSVSSTEQSTQET